jgi:FtsH-binding integral membrane protein
MWKQQRTTLMAISSSLLAVAPKCPICFLAYFGIFGVATASASVYRVWLPPLTAIWLALTVGMLFFRLSDQRRYGPGLLGAFAAFAVLVGRFVADYPALVYAGIAALVVAVIWRTWTRSSVSTEPCAQCDGLPVINHNEPGVSSS